MIATTMGLIFLSESTSFESGLPGIFVTETYSVSGIVFVIHPFV
jgi:hypothetical protein